ncbi:MAG: 16S rRNA (cytosine(1402)-N(4))-methyltransferase RsmH [Oscillospiraceae bacterium]|nr:16S rRNA (cytosine(1402)-N(4))-methyltransferase RsmH [Oscillospiraceae bacterium]
MTEFRHVPVLLRECLEGLAIDPGGVYVDGTLGGGGHSFEIAKRLTTGRLIGIDRDEEALRAAGERLAPFGEKVTLVRSNFDRLGEVLDGLGIRAVDGMLFDLGVSSPQLDDALRGFSYSQDAPLDMRMDRLSPLTARTVVNEWPEEELKRILFAYGEERYAPRIAAAIARRRSVSPIETTLELAELVRSAMPAKALREKQHPAKRTFQALRIAVNDELGSVERLLDAAPDLLREGGRLCVISFHSLEDRIVKQAIHRRVDGCTCPRDLPVCVCGFHQTLKTVGGVITASAEELAENPRARSAKLRVAQRV